MSTGNLIIGVVSLIILATPFVFASIKNSKKRKGLILKLKNFALENNCTLEEWEVDGRNILGMDKQNKIGLFASKKETEIFTQLVDLKQFTSCNVTRDSSSTQAAGSATDLLEICFYPRDKKADAETFVLYDEKEGGVLSGEYVFGTRWAKNYKELMK